jgi:UDP-glucose 4-epimerase
MTVYGDGEQTRDYVYVGDVVAANMLVTDHDFNGAAGLDERAFNVGTGRETSVNELARTLMASVGREVEINHAEARAGELRHSCLDATRLRALGWAPRTTLLDGLAATYRYIEAERVSR